MKYLKENFLKASLLLLCITVSMISCTDDDTVTTLVEEQSISMNTSENRELVTNMFTKGSTLNDRLETYRASVKNQESTDFDVDTLLSDYQQCTTCPSQYKNFLIPFFNEVKDIQDDQIVAKIVEYENLLELTSIDDLHKDNLRFTLFSFKSSAQYSIDQQYTLGKDGSPGRTIGRGMAGGFLAGCVTGAYIGGTAGTVTVPIIGTVAGAVSGCIAGGAWGAVTGAVTGGFWAAMDSIF